jgi:hypothetical protein
MSLITEKIGLLGGSANGRGPLPSRIAAGATMFLLVSAIAVPAVPEVLKYGDFHCVRFMGLREAGEWLASRKEGPSTVMCNSVSIGYYSKGTQMYLPYTNEEMALEYIRRKNPRYVILRMDEKEEAPYMEKWIETGIPDMCAREVSRIRRTDDLVFGKHQEELTIYERDCGGDG